MQKLTTSVPFFNLNLRQVNWQKAETLYIQRRLIDAKDIALNALNTALTKSDNHAVLQSNLLLGSIYTTLSKYVGDAKYLINAINHLDKAEETLKTIAKDGENAIDEKIAITLQFGHSHQQSKEYEKAENCYLQTLQESSEHNHPKGIVLSLVALSNLYVVKNDFKQAFEWINEAIPYISDNNTLGTADILSTEIYNQLAQVYLKRQDYDNMQKYSRLTLSASRILKDIEKEVISLNNLAIAHGVKSDYKTAMQYFLEVLDKSKRIGFRYNIATSLINIGTIYAHLFNYDEAQKRYQSVLNDYQDVLDINTRSITYNNIGNIYYINEQPTIAKEYFEQAYELAKSASYKEMMALTLAQLSRANTDLGDVNEALVCAEQANWLMSELGVNNSKQINLINLGKIHHLLGDSQNAIDLTQEGIRIAQKVRDQANEIRGYQILAMIYDGLKDFENAYRYQLAYSNLQTEFAKEQRNRFAIDLEIRHTMQDKQREIEQLKRENEYQGLLLEQNAQISKQNQQLVRANEELQQFAYVVSHDLKEPLRMIASYTQLIFRHYGKDGDEKTKAFFDYIHEGVIRMNGLLDALLQYATIGKSEKQLEEVDTASIVEICKFHLKLLIEETNTTITHQNDMPEIMAVPSLLVHLFQNLISNAIKFRKEGTNPVIDITACQEGNDYIFRFSDNGIGIEKAHLERIFIIFQRLHSRTQYEGTGIGLSICQKIVENLGGRIWVESEIGKGSDFYFTIPVQPKSIE